MNNRLLKKICLKIVQFCGINEVSSIDQLSGDLKKDIKLQIQTVFDVGAHTGESTIQYAKYFSEANIFSFEPSKSSYELLVSNTSGLKNVNCFQFGFGITATDGFLYKSDNSSMRRIIDFSAVPESKRESICLDSIDNFCEQKKISHINFLKIDTEGHDLEVLKGAYKMLDGFKIDIIQVEAGMNMLNKLHIPLEAFKSYLELKGYFIYRIYEQFPEWPTGRVNLRRCDPVFISQRIIEENSKLS